MNVTELARKLKIPSKELLEILPVIGFDIGKRAIKVDNKVAQKIIENWPALLKQYQQMKPKAEEEKTEEKTEEKKVIKIPAFITVKDFAIKANLPISKVLAELMKNGVLSAMNDKIDFDTAVIIGQDLGIEVQAETDMEIEEDTPKPLIEKDKSKLKPRPPVIVVLGHVDHGKTKLLDTIRKTKVMEGESGGITQHIGAYQIEVRPKGEPKSRAPQLRGEGSPAKKDGILLRQRADQDDFAPSGRKITFIDTPGHEAFSTMRSRGAKIADIAILVVAADDGIKPQTKESIKIIKSAKIPMIVAINKIDKPEANIEKVKQELASLNLIPEDWGGKTICQPISAKTGQGINELLDTLLLVADLDRDKIVANPKGSTIGTIIESHIDRGEGPVATGLIQNGTLKKGDLIIINDKFYGKVRALKDFLNRPIEQVSPSMPAKILGLKATPSVGDILMVSDKITKKEKIKSHELKSQATIAYTQLSKRVKEGEDVNYLNLIIRADVLGSLEAIIASLDKMSHPEVDIKIISKGLGNITEGDIINAEANSAIVVGFHVGVIPGAQSLAQERGIEVKKYKVIYELLDDVKGKLEELISPEVIRNQLGEVKILAVFRKDKNKMIVGGQVTGGKILSNSKSDVLRGDKIIATGMITQLQINKEDVSEISSGRECGISYEGEPIIEVNDILSVYQEVKVKKHLSS